MKKFTFFVLTLVAMMVAMPVFAQDRNNEDEVVKVDSRRDYREGEVLVKFKPTSRVNVRAKNGRFQTSAVSAVDAALEALNSVGINKVALVVFSRNEDGNAFWEKIGFSERHDLSYRNKALVDIVRMDT